MFTTFLADAPVAITGKQAISNLWNSMVGLFGKIWSDIISGQMPLVVDFFATYWIFLFPAIVGLFLFAFGMFEKLLLRVR
ncbi:hypothetical protein [Spiroplasma endosymbiont of Lonchoptera lutea]|uniref:hypothetical protein n=1 Tax=Spiroplasma endosymbiont of Lonchoptera lutea TaxID=3066297 RepID=UPI0030CF7E99